MDDETRRAGIRAGLINATPDEITEQQRRVGSAIAAGDEARFDEAALLFAMLPDFDSDRVSVQIEDDGSITTYRREKNYYVPGDE